MPSPSTRATGSEVRAKTVPHSSPLSLSLALSLSLSLSPPHIYLISYLIPLVPSSCAVTAVDGIAWLVQLLGNERAKAREHAEGALVRLSIDPANRAQIIKKLVDMLQDPGAGGQEQAAAALANLARESEDNRKSIVDANGIVPLLAMVRATCRQREECAFPIDGDTRWAD